MAYTTKVYKTSNGDKLVVASGGIVDVESGGSLKLAGTAITSTAAEINVLDGVVAGTVTASKALAVGAAKELATLGAVDIGGLVKLSAKAGAASANGLLLGVGTTADPSLNATADKHFVELRMKHTATSGDNRGIYTRTEFAGVGGGGDGFRSNTVVSAVGAGTVQGIHGSVENEATAKITGLGVGVRAGYIFADEAVPPGGTYAGLMAELWANGSSTDISGATKVSLIRAVLGGDATGIDNMDDNAFFIEFAGMTAGSGNMIDTDITTHTAYGGLRVDIPGVGTKYIPLVSD